MYVSSDQPAEFACLHVKLVSDCIDVSGKFPLMAEKIASYPSDSETKELLKALVVPVSHHAAYKVTDIYLCSIWTTKLHLVFAM